MTAIVVAIIHGIATGWTWTHAGTIWIFSVWSLALREARRKRAPVRRKR
jgi:hypothetical protein